MLQVSINCWGTAAVERNLLADIASTTCLLVCISSAPELFQRHMSIALEGLEGVACLMYDILIHRKTR